jgi:M6 family metalloprotease-like protein
MLLLGPPEQRWSLLATAVASILLAQPTKAAPNNPRSEYAENGFSSEDPFAVLDLQTWINPDNMTWDDWRAPPGTNWSDTSKKGSIRNFNIALVTVDYSDKPFTITLPAGSTPFSNPQPSVANLARDAVPAHYHDFLNKPSKLNHYHTMHEYWMGDSGGRFGVDLTAFGPYRMPSLAYQYGLSNDMNGGECPDGKTCDLSIRTDALAAWRTAVGNATADSFELVFILSAGQDESSTWQEFGEMRFQTREDVPDNFGPPAGTLVNGTRKNYAHTRYVDWTSWASASSIWPDAGDGSSTQAESSGMATYCHELSSVVIKSLLLLSPS